MMLSKMLLSVEIPCDYAKNFSKNHKEFVCGERIIGVKGKALPDTHERKTKNTQKFLITEI